MGNSESLLSEGEILELHKSTEFSVREINELLERYAQFITQPSAGNEKDVQGLTVDECLMIPEFSGSLYLRPVIEKFLDESQTYLLPYKFIQLCALLSPHTDVQKKRSFLYNHLHLLRDVVLTHEGVFRLLKQLYSNSLSDDRLLDITCQIMNDPRLAAPGQIHKNELDKFSISDDYKQ
ncbi:uncharacterized protein LOC135472698 isoform X2 [Liolophura sinensis]|uniref:uncharacterized protein LOC135472698 isoform X2 n=1 Tax=Liolophura sinensis TaxID=3198878 RepID=UPI0031591E5C